MKYSARVSTRGRIVIPKPLRVAHGWEPGDEFIVEEVPEGVLILPVKTAARKRKDNGTARQSSTAEMILLIANGC